MAARRPKVTANLREFVYSRHPDPRRVWKGGSEQHLLTPLPRAPRASSKKLYVGVFYNVFDKCLFLFSVKGCMVLCFTMKIHENTCKSMKIHENPWQSMKIHENPYTQGIKIPGTSFFPKKNACGSASHTQGIKSQERHFFRKKSACGSASHTHRAY